MENCPPHIQDHVDVLNDGLNFMKNHSSIMGNRLIIFVESAGAHYTTSCLLMKCFSSDFHQDYPVREGSGITNALLPWGMVARGAS
jgi:hypothetical protein